MIYPENYFLVILAVVWILIAVIQDFRKREVANWLNFSLIAIALIYRAFVSLFFLDYRYFVYGLIGFAIFFGLANLFYYGRLFAGGDAKLLMGLGAVLPFSFLFIENLWTFFYFIVLLLFVGSIYGLVYSFILSLKKRKEFQKEVSKQFKKAKRFILVTIIPAVFLTIFFLIVKMYLLILLPILLFVLPFLYIYAKSVEESCMLKFVYPKQLTEGDWLYKAVRVGGKTIKPNWEGLSAEELKILQRTKSKVLIKEGIPFTLAFLIAFIILIWLLFRNFNLFTIF